jgi:hypothetical protein
VVVAAFDCVLHALAPLGLWIASFCVSVWLPTHLVTHLPTYPPTFLPTACLLLCLLRVESCYSSTFPAVPVSLANEKVETYPYSAFSFYFSSISLPLIVPNPGYVSGDSKQSVGS